MINCIMLAGLFYIAGEDTRGDPFMVNLYSIEAVRDIEDQSIIMFGSGNRVSVDLPLIDVAITMDSCLQVFADNLYGEDQ